MSASYALRWHPGMAVAKVLAAADVGLMVAGEMLGEESDRITPIEEGTLIRSRTVSLDREHHRVAVAYDTPYAVRQHEDMTLTHDQGREAKYLANTGRRHGHRAQDIVGKRIREALR